MKSAIENDQTINEFWTWFGSIADSLAANVEDATLLKDLNTRIVNLHPDVSWEIGPGIKSELFLALSPNLNRSLLLTTRHIVSYAPELTNWDFYPALPPKLWDYRFEIEHNGSVLVIDAAAWSYVMLRYPDANYELLIEGTEKLPNDEDVRWQICAILLQGILGEEILLERIDHFELFDQIPSEFRALRKPIKQLRSAVVPEGVDE